PGESISLSGSFSAESCSTQDLLSTLSVGWGKPGDYLTNESFNTTVQVYAREPKLSIISSSPAPLCFGAEITHNKILSITNEGEGVAAGLELDIFNSSGTAYDEQIIAGIDPSSFQYRKENATSWEALTPISSSTTSSEGAYACLGKKSLSKAKLSLPDLRAGESLTLTWNTRSCCVNLCQGEKNTGWGYSMNYKNICASNSYEEKGIGEKSLSAKVTYIGETPTDIADGQTANFIYNLDKVENDYPQGEGASYDITFQIPQGLIFSGKEQDISFRKGKTSWAASNIDFQANSGKLTLTYALPAPFELPQSEVNLVLTADASKMPNGGNLAVDFSMSYTPSTTCGDACTLSVLCGSNELAKSGLSGDKGTILHKSSLPAEGLAFSNFSVNRMSFGLADNDQDGKADSGTNLDMNQIKTNRAFVGDQIQAVFKGTVYSASSGNWPNAYAETRLLADSSLSFSSASLRIYDASAAAYINCSQITANTSYDGGDKLFLYDLSPATLSSLCSNLSSFSYEDGDSIWLEVDYVVSENVGGSIKEVDFENELYLAASPNPEEGGKVSNDSWSGRMNLVGYYLENGSMDSLEISTCSDFISQKFRMKVGSSFAGGDLFPYEYRNFSYTQKAKVSLPDNYEILSAYLEHYTTIAGGSIDTQRVENLTADEVSANDHIFDLDQYYEANGGVLSFSDEGFEDILYVQIAPNTSANTNTFEPIAWEADFASSGSFCSYTPEYKLAHDDVVKYIPAEIEFGNSSATIQALTEITSWELEVSNIAAGAAQNSWIHFHAPNSDVSILRLIDTESGDTLNLSGDLFQIGEIAANSTKTLQIDFSSSSCTPTQLDAYLAFECREYPSSYAAWEGEVDSASYTIEPQTAGLSGTLSKSGSMVSCGSEMSVTLELSNILAGNANDIQIEVDPAAGSAISVKAGTAKIKYPLSAAYQSMPDPTISDGKVVFDLERMLPNLFPQGLPGESASIPLSSLVWESATTGWGSIKKNTNLSGGAMRINNNSYDHGIATHANSDIVYNLNGQYKNLKTDIGIDETA
ncbi:MAG: NPCBM/NEW2 domain-containing protein, partial [Bacteroidota bacterium]